MAAGNGADDGFQIFAEKPAPDVYCDSLRLETKLFGVTLDIGQSQLRGGGPNAGAVHVSRIRVHMSPQHAKIAARLLLKNIQEYEQQIGKINIPADVLMGLNILEEGDL